MSRRLCAIALCSVLGSVAAAQPAAEVTKQLGETLASIDTATQRVRTVSLGASGSVLRVTSKTGAPGGAIWLRFTYASDPANADELALGFMAAKIKYEQLVRLARANKLEALRATASGEAGSATMSVVAASRLELLRALPKILSELTTARIDANDLGPAVSAFEALAPPALPKVSIDLDLARRLYSNAPAYLTVPAAELMSRAKQLRTTQIERVLQAWRTGHVEIATIGEFSAQEVAIIERTVTAALKDWKLAAPTSIQRTLAARKRDILRLTWDRPPYVSIGYAIDAPDELTALALHLMFQPGGPFAERFRAKSNVSLDVRTEPVDRLGVSGVPYTARQFQIEMTLHPEKAADVDRVLAIVRGELEALRKVGLTAAELAEAQLSALRGIDPLSGSDKSGPTFDALTTEPPLADRKRIAAKLVTVTRDALVEALRRHVSPDALVVTALTPMKP